MMKGRITITFTEDGEVRAVVYPKNKDNEMYGIVLEYLLNSKKCKNKAKDDILHKLLSFNKCKVYSNELKSISDNTDNA